MAPEVQRNPQPFPDSRSLVREMRLYLGRCLHLGERPTVDEISVQVGMSRRHFRRLFREECGLTPRTFITRWKVHCSAFLSKRGLKKGAIAERLGYSENANFLRFMRTVRRKNVPK